MVRSPLRLAAPRPASLALLLLLTTTSACARGLDQDRKAGRSAPPAVVAAAAPSAASPGGETMARRVIRTGDLSLETDAPEEVSRKVGALAEARGGFVVSSDTTRTQGEDGAEWMTTTLVVRVPAASFGEALDGIRALAKRVASEKITGQDVTEEYLDLEARVRTQRAVEEQYLVIMKEAKSIRDTLDVQQKLGEIRTEIERAEGRRRYLENQTSLSTITVHVARHIQAVDASGPGFGRSAKAAVRDAVNVSVNLVNGGIRLVGVLVPLTVFFGPPIWLFVAFSRRRKRMLEAKRAG